MDLAIVILNWNGKNYLEKFLPSVTNFSKGHRIIVADNASTDDSVIFIKNNYPEIELIINSSNGGFAKGYNDALKKIDAEFYLLLNSDIEVTENWLEPLLKSMQDPSVAGCQPKILAYHNKKSFEHAGASGGFIDKDYFPFCRGRILDVVEEDLGQYNHSQEIFWATGAALLIRSKLYHEVGELDEDFFAHMEEIDLCWRLKKKGYRFMVEPESVVYHVGGGALPYTSPRKTYLNFRNSLYMLVKNHEGILIFKLLQRMILDGLAAAKFLIGGEFAQFKSVFNAHMTFYKNLGKTLKKRKEIKASSSKFNRVGMFNGSIIWNRYFKGIKKFSDLNQRKFF